MSKNIVIQEGGVGRQFVADKLKTALVGGGSCNWVPEDEVQLSTLTVSENGTYSAEDEGGYGYSQVIVNVPGGAGGPPGGEGSSIVGTDPNTGNEELVSVDDGGTIGTTELPSSIKIETAPTKVDYIDGDPIDYSGLVVKAYTKNGELWTDADHPDGIIPLSELTLSETEADIDKTETDKGTRTLDGLSVEVARVMKISQNVDGHLNMQTTNTCPDGVVIINGPYFTRRFAAVSDDSDAAIHYANSQEGEWRYNEKHRGEQGFVELTKRIGVSHVTGKQLYYVGVVGWDWVNNIADPELEAATDMDDLMAADIALYGAGSIGGGETIPVVWMRPGDTQALKDSFVITVIAHVAPDDEENPGAGGIPIVPTA